MPENKGFCRALSGDPRMNPGSAAECPAETAIRRKKGQNTGLSGKLDFLPTFNPQRQISAMCLLADNGQYQAADLETNDEGGLCRAHGSSTLCCAQIRQYHFLLMSGAKHGGGRAGGSTAEAWQKQKQKRRWSGIFCLFSGGGSSRAPYHRRLVEVAPNVNSLGPAWAAAHPSFGPESTTPGRIRISHGPRSETALGQRNANHEGAA